MTVGLVSYVAIGIGVLLIIMGLIIKRVTRKKVDELDGFVGIANRASEDTKDKGFR